LVYPLASWAKLRANVQVVGLRPPHDAGWIDGEGSVRQHLLLAVPAVSLVAWLVPLHASGARDADPAIGDDT
jgi:hypothetical protein